MDADRVGLFHNKFLAQNPALPISPQSSRFLCRLI
jgi:hypothetical protein